MGKACHRFLLTFTAIILTTFCFSGRLFAETVEIDAASEQHPINPLIYGVSFGDTSFLDTFNIPVNRFGGNRTTRYNYQVNADATANDWFFESYPGSSATTGEIVDSFVTGSKNASSQSMITVPLIDWIVTVNGNRTPICNFSIMKYGAQQAHDGFWPDCGNGKLPNGDLLTGNDPTDGNVPNSTAFQQGMLQHLIGAFGNSGAGGVKYYLLDNESGIWHSTHRDVHPIGASMDEMKQKMLDYSAMIKAQDPNALVAGPEEWGWTGYLMSGLDQQTCAAIGGSCWSDPPDRHAHAGATEYVTWLLDQFHNHETTTGTRILDVFSLHFYPQSGEYSNDTSMSMQLLRNRSTRGLWDRNYVNESWIGDKVYLIPRMNDWIAAHYPGTRTAITEYNWGAFDHMNGATTQADVLGIFGREGLDIGNIWTAPDSGSPVAKAFKMYRNYDGNKSAFGETSIHAALSSGNVDNVAPFASLRASDGALTIMVINKDPSGARSITVNLANFTPGASAHVWRLQNNAINTPADVAIASNSFTASLPAQTVTLFVVPPGVAPNPDFTLDCSPSTVFAMNGGSGSSNCSTTSIAGFNTPVTLSCSGLPGGASCVFGTNPVTPPASSGLTVNVDGAVAPGSYPFTVTGDGTVSHSVAMTLSVSAATTSLLLDEFDDNAQTWTVSKGVWAEANGALSNTSKKMSIIAAPTPWSPSGVSFCSNCTLETDISLAGKGKFFVQHWMQDKKNRVDLSFKAPSGKVLFKQKSNGKVVAKTKATFAMLPAVQYHLKISFDGAAFHVAIDGTTLFDLPTSVVPSGNLQFEVMKTFATIQGVNVY